MTENTYELEIDIVPKTVSSSNTASGNTAFLGAEYGFPKILPREAVEGTGDALVVKESFDLMGWIVEQGCPKEEVESYEVYLKNIFHDTSGIAPSLIVGDDLENNEIE